MNINLRLLFNALLALTAPGTWTSAVNAAEAASLQKPNILFVLADDLEAVRKVIGVS
jgi:hypothetical protein